MLIHPAVCLPFSFNPQRLVDELHQVRTEEWISHYRSSEYEGDWAIVALRSVAGHPDIIHAAPGARQENFYKNTPLLDRCPYFREVLSRFECGIGAARLMRLGPGAKILEHSDHMGEDGDQELRIHIPVQTNEQVQFWLGGQLLPMCAGETWYADFRLPHRVENNGSSDRVHLVLDCEPNPWLLGQIRKSVEIAQMTGFLERIGIACNRSTLEEATFLPGIKIQAGAICIDPEKLNHPGDILHEAGHIAVTLPGERALLDGNVGENDPNAMGQEIAAILWSYAALKSLGLPEENVFHAQGYKGQSDWYIENFTSGHYIGLPLLEWMEMCAGPKKAMELGIEPFPSMRTWLRMS